MQLCLRELDCWSDEIISIYKEKFILPLDTKINKGLFVEVERWDAEDDWDTTLATIDLCSASRIAVVMVDLSHFFEEVGEDPHPRPYELYKHNIEMLTSEGRQIASVWKQEMEKRHYSVLPTNDIKQLVFGMLQSGLVY